MLNDEGSYDITIEVGNGPYIKYYVPIWLIILLYRSPYLQYVSTSNTSLINTFKWINKFSIYKFFYKY